MNRISRWLSLLFVGFTLTSSSLPAQSFSRDLQVDVYVNQVGFVPDAHKRCVVPNDPGARQFQIIKLESQQVIFTGQLSEATGDFGHFLAGDFSSLKTTGTYCIRAGSHRSYPFRISGDAYSRLLETMVWYFALQRCGPSTTGYLAPCHLHDGVRLDNGEHQDVTGGWHDASDL